MITKVKSNFFGKYKTDKELYNLVFIWVKTNLVGKHINRDEINKPIELSWQGLKNDLNEVHPPYDKKLISFAVLDTILEKSKFILIEKDKKGNPDVKNIYKFLGKVQIDKEVFDVLIIIKETSKTFIYDHILLKT